MKIYQAVYKSKVDPQYHFCGKPFTSKKECEKYANWQVSHSIDIESFKVSEQYVEEDADELIGRMLDDVLYDIVSFNISGDYEEEEYIAKINEIRKRYKDEINQTFSEDIWNEIVEGEVIRCVKRLIEYTKKDPTFQPNENQLKAIKEYENLIQ